NGGLIRAAGATGRRLCTRSSIVCRSRRRKYWPLNLGGTRCLSDEVLSYTGNESSLKKVSDAIPLVIGTIKTSAWYNCVLESAFPQMATCLHEHSFGPGGPIYG